MGNELTENDMRMFSQLVYTDIPDVDDDKLKLGQYTVSMYLDKAKNNFLENGFTEKQIEEFRNRCGDFTIDPNIMDDNKKSGLYGVIIKKSNDEAVVVFRGSENFPDWPNNASSLTTIETAQYKKIQEYIDKGIFNKYTKINVTGHSLGGHNGIYFSVVYSPPEGQELDLDCKVFNAPGFNSTFQDIYKGRINELKPHLINFRGESDLVSGIMDDVATPVLIKTPNPGFLGHSLSELSVSSDGSLDRSQNKIPEWDVIMVHEMSKLLEYHTKWGHAAPIPYVYDKLKDLNDLNDLNDVYKYILSEFAELTPTLIASLQSKLGELRQILLENVDYKNLINSLKKHEIVVQASDFGALSVGLDSINHMANRLKNTQSKINHIKYRINHMNYLISVNQIISNHNYAKLVSNINGVEPIINYLQVVSNKLELCENKINKDASLFS